MNKIEIKAPNKLAIIPNNFKIFLAGSITSGKDDGDMANDWQTKFVENFENSRHITFFNPRRDNWDNSFGQNFINSDFYQQVNWELKALELSDLIVMYIDPKTTAPITLLELGLYAKSNKLIVCCPDGFYRKGNVDIVCNYYGIPLVEDFYSLIKMVEKIVQRY